MTRYRFFEIRIPAPADEDEFIARLEDFAEHIGGAAAFGGRAGDNIHATLSVPEVWGEVSIGDVWFEDEEDAAESRVDADPADLKAAPVSTSRVPTTHPLPVVGTQTPTKEEAS